MAGTLLRRFLPVGSIVHTILPRVVVSQPRRSLVSRPHVATVLLRSYVVPSRPLWAPTKSDIDDEFAPASVTQEEVKEAIQSIKAGASDCVIIDVRRDEEVVEGVVDTAHHLPMEKVADAFVLSDEKFEATYGFAKPSPTSKIILYCRNGQRSEMTGFVLKAFGFTNVFNYRGGASEWFRPDSV